jgi:hypothetical protein
MITPAHWNSIAAQKPITLDGEGFVTGTSLNGSLYWSMYLMSIDNISDHI